MATRKSNKQNVDPLAHRVAERYVRDMFAMSNLHPNDTGVGGVVIWVSVGEFGGADAQHGPRIKVAPGTKMTPESLNKAVSVTLADPPAFLGKVPGKTKKQITEFVNTNRDTLLRYWNRQLTTREMLDLIQKV